MHAAHSPSRQRACIVADRCTLKAIFVFILFDTAAGGNGQRKWCMVTAAVDTAGGLCKLTLVTAGLSLDLLVDK